MKTFGTVRLKGDKWVIDCEPHVLIRMKRVFGKIGKHSHGTIRMSATDENSADLRWFLERYPMDVQPADALESKAKAYRDRMSLVDAMLSRQVAPPPFDLAVPLREYQRIAAGITLQTGSLLLADEVGLGKTASAIGVLSDPKTLPALVVTLTHLPRQWEAEIHRFAPRLRTHVLKQATPYDLTSLGGRGKQLGLPGLFPDVIITSYSKLSGWADTLAPLVKSVIWDECVTADTRVMRWPVEPDVSTRIVDLSPGDSIASFDESGNIVQDHVLCVTPKGTREVWRITLADGRALECTSNERIMTEAGWRYAAEIINEAFLVDERESLDATRWNSLAASARNDAWGREPGPGPDAPTDLHGARPSAGRLLQIQGEAVEGLRAHGSEGSAEQRIREAVLHVPHGDHPGIRVLALPLYSGGGRAHEEDCHAGMAGTADLGRGGILVHGRRERDEKGCRHQHSLVLGVGGEATRQLVRGTWNPSAGRHGPQNEQANVLGFAVQGGRCGEVDQLHPSVCPGMHGIQDRVRGSEADGVHVLWGACASSQQTHGCERGHLPTEGMQVGLQPAVMGHQEAANARGGRIIPCRIASVERVGPRPVFDVEVASRHTLFANGFAVHNCQELRREGDPRNPSRKYTAAKHIADHTSLRMGLSATPFYNYGDELRSVMNCIRPDALGTKAEFLQEWCVSFGADKHKIKDPAAFGMYLREGALMLRRTRSEVGREIPPITKIPHHIDADASAIEKAEDAAAELARIILTQGGRGFDKMQAAQDLDYRLRQATGVAKAPFVAEFVRLLVESGEKVVLYGWHREFYSILCDRLKDLNPALYTGTESATQKEEAKRRFVSGETPVLIMSLRSGAGLDGLQSVCRTVVIGELDWSPGVLEQCIGRVARDGQADPVVVYYLLAETGSDPIISDVLQLKRQQIEGVRDPDAELVEQLDTGEDRMRRLAEGLLRQRGLPVPAKEGEVAA